MSEDEDHWKPFQRCPDSEVRSGYGYKLPIDSNCTIAPVRAVLNRQWIEKSFSVGRDLDGALVIQFVWKGKWPEVIHTHAHTHIPKCVYSYTQMCMLVQSLQTIYIQICVWLVANGSASCLGTWKEKDQKTEDEAEAFGCMRHDKRKYGKCLN